jgi:hypothetical protein
VHCAFFVQLLAARVARHSHVQHWETFAAFMRQHSLVRDECIAVGMTVMLLWLKAINVAGLRRRIGAAADQRLTGDPSTAPPPVTGYTDYIPCALYVAPSNQRRLDRGAFGLAPGVLYIGPEGISFQPRVTGLFPGTPSVPPFTIGPIREVTATAVRATQGIVDALAGRRHALHLRWRGSTALFRVPSLGDALPQLHARLDELKYGPS